VIIDVPYDGDCFLHAVLHQLSCLGQQPVTETVLSLRRGALLCLKSNHASTVNEHFDRRLYKDCNDYLTHQSLPGIWLDEIMIRGICNFLNRQVNIYHANDHITVITPNRSEHEGITSACPDMPPLMVRYCVY
jgi:OTU-like cysteine protease